MTTKLYTDIDLDGISCAIIGRMFFDDIDIYRTHIVNLDQKLGSDYSELSNVERIYFTDLSMNLDNAEILDKKKIELKDLKLIDHHKSAMHYNDKYDWSLVQVESHNESEGRMQLECGASLFLKYLVSNNIGKITDKQLRNLTEYVELVRRYDTWEWNLVYDDKDPLNLSTLLHCIGYKSFEEEMIQIIKGNNSFKLNKKQEYLIESEAYRKTNVVYKKINSATFFLDDKNRRVALVMAEDYISEIGNSLCLTENIDYAMMVSLDRKSISLRTAKDSLDLSLIARENNGGGHAKAAGFSMASNTKLSTMVKDLIKEQYL